MLTPPTCYSAASPGILLRPSWLCDPRPAWLSRYGNSPADGFRRFSRPSCCAPFRRDLLSPFLIGLGALFLTAAVLPASVLESAVATGVTVVDVFDYGAEIVTAEDPGLGIAGDNLSEPGGITSREVTERDLWLPNAGLDAAPNRLPDKAALNGVLSSERLSIPARLAALSNSHAVWIVAFSPWVWCLFSWHVPPRPPRRVRRVRRQG